MIRFEIAGKIKPYVRMTRKGKFVRERNGKPTQAAQYLDSKMSLALQLKEQMRGREMFGPVPLFCSIIIYEVGGYHNRDLDNEAKALLDAMNGIVYIDDRWIDGLCAIRGSRDDVDFSASITVGTWEELRVITVF